MKLFVVFVVLLFLSLPVSARGYRQTHRIHFKINTGPLENGTVGQEYCFLIYGAGDRPMYGADVKVSYDGSYIASGMTDVYGNYSFTPEVPGIYYYRVEQSRYFTAGGWFTVV
ncbi:MAG: hypothetical protein KKD39_00350 [Candidatus Altiarchaeota archaeon]|nr:hypothetical protein [Candidatus Altiarchaeota archaeon]